MSPASPEGPGYDGLREKDWHRLVRETCTGYGPAQAYAVSEALWPAVLPLLTAEREQADALQRQVDAVRAAQGEIEATWVEFAAADERGEFGDRCDRDPCRICTFGAHLQSTVARLRAALSRTATERLPHADVSGLTPETCPQRDNHGSPFRFCPVKGCGWHEGMQR